MLCSFCLDDVRFKQKKVDGLQDSIYLCPTCNEQVPAMYSQDYRRFPPVVISAVGFRQHGKTVYFASLFYTLKKLDLGQDWPDFYTISLDDDSITTAYDNAAMLDAGMLPDSTPKNFPRPTMIRAAEIPKQPDCTLLFFDTGGECFEKPTQLVQFAGFVKRAKAVMLLVSIADMEDPRTDIQKLLNTYIVGLGELGGKAKDQHLIVVYTKADRLVSGLQGEWSDLYTYLIEGSVDDLTQTKGYIDRMKQISDRLYDFTEKQLQAHEFLNAAEANFKGISFSIISALGTEPQGARLSVQIIPRRILDPVLWVMQKSFSRSDRFFDWLWG